MDILVLVVTAICLLLGVAVVTILKNRQPKNENSQPVPETQQPRPESNARRRALAANRNARTVRRVQEDEDGSEPEKPEIELPEGKIGAKKLAKLQAKAEKKAQRENEEKIRQEKKKAQELADEERRKIEQKEKEEERRKAEEEKKIREEKERQEHEEYLKLKEAFSVQEEGFEENEESETLLQDFINYIKKNKIVVLEDLAAEFRLKTQDVINRINSLQAENLLTGVIDDRGKFIYITEEELSAVAKFVKQRGRVSITEVLENSNKLIDLSSAAC